MASSSPGVPDLPPLAAYERLRTDARTRRASMAVEPASCSHFHLVLQLWSSHNLDALAIPLAISATARSLQQSKAAVVEGFMQ